MGDWLAFAGFPIGTYAVLQAGEGRIVIEAKGHISDPGAAEHRRRRPSRPLLCLLRRSPILSEPPRLRLTMALARRRTRAHPMRSQTAGAS